MAINFLEKLSNTFIFAATFILTLAAQLFIRLSSFADGFMIECEPEQSVSCLKAAYQGQVAIVFVISALVAVLAVTIKRRISMANSE